MSNAARRPSPQRVAYHEAGHAVVACLLGNWPVRISIRKYRKTAGRVTFRMTTLSDRSDVERQIMIVLAGPFAEGIHLEEEIECADLTKGWGNDAVQFLGLRDLLDLDEIGKDEVVSAVAVRVRELLMSNWRKVDIVARLLLDMTRLTRRQLVFIMEAV